MRSLILLVIAAVSAVAIDYTTFETRVLETSPALEKARLESDAAHWRGQIALRYENPSFEGELGRYDPDGQSAKNGWRAALSQPLRIFGLQRELAAYAEAMKEVAERSYEDRHAAFKALLRTRYSAYVYEARMLKLIDEEIELARRLESIAEARLENGAGTRAQLMQAALERIDAETRRIEQRRRIAEHYYALLEAAAFDEKVPLEATFLYPVETLRIDDGPDNPRLQELKARKRLYERKAKSESHPIKSYRLFAEYENEPDQSIARVGIGLDLPLFARNLEERQIARIRAKGAELEAVRLEAAQRVALESLLEQSQSLAERYEALEKRLQKERELLALFEEGYRTAQSSLLELIETKNSLIETERALLVTRYRANLYRIRIDYLKGTLK
ncbi:TolC family protein [Hydrogenimonas sp.]